MTIRRLLSGAKHWVSAHPDVLGIILVGSHARGCARPDFDVDSVIVVTDPQRDLRDTGWTTTVGAPRRQVVEVWGKAASLRVCMRVVWKPSSA